MNFPENLKYTKDHEWILVEGNQATIGITDFAQDSLGDVVMVELPEIGADFSQDGTIGVVESVKSVSDVFSPVTGKIVEVNQDLLDSPEIINEDPYEKGWFCKIELSDGSEVDGLMDVGTYRDLIEA